jgi:hypothetical protein
VVAPIATAAESLEGSLSELFDLIAGFYGRRSTSPQALAGS